jgi:adenosylcobinamide-GDP ribazoletransferase
MREDLKLELQLFGLALQFMTRLPIRWDLPYSDDLALRAAKYYPLVGAVVGGLGALVYVLASIGLSSLPAALLAVATTVILTGAFHEDGLADAADGLVGGASRDRALEIMRDSRVGSYGALALVLMIGLKVSLLAELSVWQGAMALIATHVLGRMAAVHVIATTRYARSSGMKFAIPRMTRDGYRVALATSVLALILLVVSLGLGTALAAFSGAVLLAQGMRYYALQKLGGYTGDILGAVEQMGELGVLLAVALWL